MRRTPVLSRQSSDLIERLERRALLSAAVGGWTPIDNLPKARGLTTDLSLKAAEPFNLTTASMAHSLSYAPQENVAKYGIGRGAGSRLINVPTPAGGFARFRVVESAVMTGADAKKFTNIKTYAGVGVDDPTASIRLDMTPLGFHAQVLTPTGGAYYVDPLYRQTSSSVYVSYYAKDSNRRGPTDADHDDMLVAGKAAKASAFATSSATAARNSGTQLRTYRTAVAATAEYTAYFGGTVAAGQAAIVSAINRVTGVYETELGIRLTLVSNNSSLVFTNTNTDGYTNDDGGAMLSQNQTKVDSIIGAANYDIGHVFSTGGGGVAYLGVVGRNGSKAGGVTGSGAPTGDAFWIDYVAHEMGHQFGGDHTFNTSQDPNRNAATAVEPGSGSTIMAYAGIEGNEDLQANSDPYFSFISVNQILTYVDSTVPNVGTRTATNNTAPTVTTTGTMAYTIPANTPFTLTSPTASDAQGDAIYYSWEEADAGTADLLNAADNGSGALFRVYNPTTNPSRTFPRLASVLAGSTTTQARYSGRFAERLPTQSRTMKFVLTLRDQRAGGGGTNVLSGTGNGVSSGTITPTATVSSVAAASSFAISNFNTAATLSGGSSQTITWNVAGTTGNGINTANVNILMSTDGGQTFATTLAAGTANDGSETVTLPNISSSLVRFKVAAVGNIYFDINNANLTVNAVAAPSATPGTPDLFPFSDTGASNTDNITTRNNSSSANNLIFTVSGTVSGASVAVYSDGTAIGVATATGTTTAVQTNGTTALLDGTHTITAQQLEPGKTISAVSAGLPVVIDTVAPTITGNAFAYQTVKPQVSFNFSEPVANTTSASNYSTGTTASTITTPTATATTPSSVTLTFPTAPNGILPNGNYTVSILQGSNTITDVAGNLLAGNSIANFFVLAGDANHDRVTDFNDFLVLQNNFGQSVLDFTRGDFNYDGVVDFNDFLILQNNFGATV